MKSWCITLVLLSGLTASAQSPLIADAHLESVIVFNKGAEMNHRARISLPAGSSEVVINNIANTLDEKSIQIGSNANITILSVSFSRNYLKTENKSAEYLKVEDSLKLAVKALNSIINERETEEKVSELLDKNMNIGGEQTGLNVTELMKLADYYKKKQTEIKSTIAILAEKEEKQEEKIGKLKKQLSELARDQSGTAGQIILQIMAKTSATSEFNVSYLTPNAGWIAFYDLRTEKINDPLKIFYKANVTQSTGIDWNKIKLKLSTGNPSQNSIAPILSTWMLRFGQPYNYSVNNAYQNRIQTNDIVKRPVTDLLKALDGQAPGINIASGGGQPGATSEINLRGVGSMGGNNAPLIVVDGAPYDGTLADIDPETVASTSFLKDGAATSLYGSRGVNGVILITTKNKSLINYTTTAENELNATFDIDIPYDIASNAKPHSVSLKEYVVPAGYKYYAVPKLDPDAFLLAEISDYEKLNLTPGDANIIFENTYVGKSFINPSITTDTLNLSMGRDKKITIKRERVSELTGTKFIGSSRKQIYTYEIRVRNGKKETVNLLLKDQYPIGIDSDIEVELINSDNAEVNKETGVLTWKLNVNPGETRTVRMSYSIKYPKDKTLANL